MNERAALEAIVERAGGDPACPAWVTSMAAQGLEAGPGAPSAGTCGQTPPWAGCARLAAKAVATAGTETNPGRLAAMERAR